MVSNIFIALVVLALAALSANEILRYRRAQSSRAEFIYPLARLRRRLGVAALTVGLLGFGSLEPTRLGNGWALGWILACLTGLWLLLRLILRDLRETSASVVVEHRRFEQALQQRMKSALQSVEDADPNAPDGPAPRDGK